MELKNNLLLRAANGLPTERPPVWLMRQAGRILPQYRAVRSSLQHFKQLVENPALACEVTIQPVDELDVDAAIIFSDILVIPEAMGLPYGMEKGKGPTFERVIQTEADIRALLTNDAAADQLQYVYDAIALTKRTLDGRVPLIGFAGAPWTILCYMVEGAGSKTFSKAKKFLYRHPSLAHHLLQKITDATIIYMHRQIASGADLVQLFDSWAGILSPHQYRAFALPYLQQICDAIQTVPKTVFAKGAYFALQDFAALDCQVVGLDWNMDISASRNLLGNDKTLQGNLDPCQLYAEPEDIRAATLQMLKAFGNTRHIANLGHGVYPDTSLEGVKAFVQTVKGYTYPASNE